MKRFFLLGLMALVLNLTAQCQKEREKIDVEINASDLLNRSAYYKVSAAQRELILKRKKTIGREFSAISKNNSLTGEQKEQKKRELAKIFKKDIEGILNEEQREKWNSYLDAIPIREQQKKNIESQLEALEDKYDRDIERIKKEYQHDDKMRKTQEKTIKATYKTKKSELENQKDLL